MPLGMPRRLARTKQLVRAYTRLHKSQKARGNRRLARFKKLLRRHHISSPKPIDLSDVDSIPDLSFPDSASDSDFDMEDAVEWAEVLGVDWRQEFEIDLPTTFSDIASMPDLAPADEDDSSSYGAASETDSDLQFDADDESDSGESDAEEEHRNSRVGRWARLRRYVQEQISEMYANRYEMPRDTLPRGPSYLHHVLMVLKNSRADEFRLSLRVTPATFDALVLRIQDDEVFASNSNNPQMPVEEQLAIALYRFGHDGNACSLQSVANWAGVGKGTVIMVTERVMTALLRPDFMDEVVHFPTEDEKEEAKRWIAKHSCEAWSGGWCMVDGTLVPLVDRPTWFGESYFDRKCRYSLNVQIVSLPNLRIVDFSYGHVGSTHDSTAWESTRLAQEHDLVLEEGEWVWADSAYPINTWIIAPYKKPERDYPDNEVFNNHVSMLRIRSEHAIGFLKGRFHSLKNLRLHINSKKRHIVATYWVAACIATHSFALVHEEKEREAAGEVAEDGWEDSFVAEGLSASSESEMGGLAAAAQARTSAGRLKAAKECREKLKRRLFRAKERRMEQAAQRRRMHLDIYDSDADD